MPKQEQDQATEQTTKDGDTIVANVKHPKKWPKRLAVILLLLLLVAGGAAAGWYYQKKQTDKAEKKAAEQSEQAAKLQKQVDELKAGSTAPAAVDETADWSTFTSNSSKLTFKYNPDWSSKSCSDNDVTAVYLAPPPTTQAICNSEKGAMISVSSIPGDQRSVAATDYDANGSNVVKSDVTLGGVAGKKVTYTADGDEFIAAGTKLVTYEFFTGGRTYIASYVQAPGDPNVLSDFDLLVNSTLVFS